MESVTMEKTIVSHLQCTSSLQVLTRFYYDDSIVCPQSN